MAKSKQPKSKPKPKFQAPNPAPTPTPESPGKFIWGAGMGTGRKPATPASVSTVSESVLASLMKEGGGKLTKSLGARALGLVGGPMGAIMTALMLPGFIQSVGGMLGVGEGDAEKALETERFNKLMGNAMLLGESAREKKEARSTQLTSQVLGAMQQDNMLNQMQMAQGFNRQLAPRDNVAAMMMAQSLATQGDPAAMTISAQTPFSDAGLI